MMRVILCFATLACLSCGLAAVIPSFIKPCSSSDPNLNQCLINSATIAIPYFGKGLPELGIKPLDPVALGKVVVNNPALNVTFQDTVVTGLGGSRVNSFKMNQARDTAVLDFTANVTLKARYVIDGQVLILPIKGEGETKIKITNLNIVIKYEYKIVDGKWNVASYKDSYKMDKAVFKFTNLFGGNKQLSDVIHVVINENWEPVIRDIAPVAFDTIIATCVNEAKKLFAAVPAKQLLL